MILTITMNPAIDKVYSVNDFEINNVFRPDDMTATAGGKGLNVARTARLMGEKVAASGLIGGSNAAFIEREIKKNGIENMFCKIDGETRICINIMDQKNNTSTEILEPGPLISQKELDDFLITYEKALRECQIVSASGSLPGGVPADFYRKLIEIARDQNKKFILDTSGEYLKEGIKSAPYMIKPNEDEIAAITGEKVSSIKECKDALIMFKKTGIELPIITLGQDGSIALIEDDFYHFKPPVVEVKNSVGSGDSFVAGCLFATVKNMDLVSVLKTAMAFGVANTQFFKTGFVSKQLVDRYLEKIKVNEI